MDFDTWLLERKRQWEVVVHYQCQVRYLQQLLLGNNQWKLLNNIKLLFGELCPTAAGQSVSKGVVKAHCMTHRSLPQLSFSGVCRGSESGEHRAQRFSFPCSYSSSWIYVSFQNNSTYNNSILEVILIPNNYSSDMKRSIKLHKFHCRYIVVDLTTT